MLENPREDAPRPAGQLVECTRCGMDLIAPNKLYSPEIQAVLDRFPLLCEECTTPEEDAEMDRAVAEAFAAQIVREKQEQGGSA